MRHRWAAVMIHLHYGFVRGRHDAAWQTRHLLVIHRTEICLVWRPHIGCNKVWRFLTQQFSCCTCAVRCASALSCWNTESLPDTLRTAGSTMTSLWRCEAASKKTVSKRYHQNFLLCNNNKITACIALFNSFVNKYMRLHFSSSAAADYR